MGNRLKHKTFSALIVDRQDYRPECLGKLAMRGVRFGKPGYRMDRSGVTSEASEAIIIGASARTILASQRFGQASVVRIPKPTFRAFPDCRDVKMREKNKHSRRWTLWK